MKNRQIIFSKEYIDNEVPIKNSYVQKTQLISLVYLSVVLFPGYWIFRQQLPVILGFWESKFLAFGTFGSDSQLSQLSKSQAFGSFGRNSQLSQHPGNPNSQLLDKRIRKRWGNWGNPTKSQLSQLLSQLFWYGVSHSFVIISFSIL